MAYPYKKMTSEDFDYIRSVTASGRCGKKLQRYLSQDT